MVTAVLLAINWILIVALIVQQLFFKLLDADDAQRRDEKKEHLTEEILSDIID